MVKHDECCVGRPDGHSIQMWQAWLSELLLHKSFTSTGKPCALIDELNVLFTSNIYRIIDIG